MNLFVSIELYTVAFLSRVNRLYRLSLTLLSITCCCTNCLAFSNFFLNLNNRQAIKASIEKGINNTIIYKIVV